MGLVAIVISLIFILSIGFLIRIPYLDFPIDEDFGFYTYLAYFRKRGASFLKDFWWGFPPTMIYLYLIIERFFGGDVKYVRHLSNFYNLFTILATFILTKYLFDTPVAIIAALLYAIFSASPYLGVYSCHAEGFYILPLTLGVFAIVHGLSDFQPMYFLLAGGFIAASFLLKIVNIVYFISFSLFLIKYSIWYGLYFSFSFLSIIVIYAFLVTRNFKKDSHKLWIHHLIRLKTSMSYIDNTLKAMWKIFKFDFVPIWRETSSIIFLALLSLLHLFFVGQGILRNILILWALSTIFILVFQRVFRMYHFIPFIHVTSILSALSIHRIIEFSSGLSSAMHAFIISPLIIITFSALIFNIYNKLHSLNLYRRDKRTLYFQKADQFFYIPEIAKYIRERTSYDEHIYVWGPFVQIYRLADRMSCEGFLFHFIRPYNRWHTYLFDGVLKGIIEKRPAYIVLIRPDFDMNILLQITGLEYNLERVFFNRYRVYRLKGKISEPMNIEGMEWGEKIRLLEYLTHGSMDYRIDDYYLKRNMYEEAMNEYRKGLELNPNDILMKFGMASLMRSQKRYEEAFNLYQKIAKLDEKMEWLHLEKSITYREMGDVCHAIKELEIEERLYPGKADTHHQRGIIYRLQHYYNMALEEFNHTLDINPEFEYVHHEKGITYREMGNMDNAIKEFELEEKLYPGSEWVHHEKGITYREMGNMENAVKEFEMEEMLYPGKIFSVYNLYSTYEDIGRNGEAMAGFYDILKNERTPVALRGACYFHLGRINMKEKKINESIKLFKRCLEIVPGHIKAERYLKELIALDSEVYPKKSYEYTDDKNSPILFI